MNNITSLSIEKRYLEIEVAGVYSRIAAPRSMNTKEVQQALDYTYSMLCQTCYMEYVIADNFLILAADILKKKGVLRFAVKHNFVELQKAVRGTRRIYEAHMNEEYYNEYSSVLYDKVTDLIEKLRKVIENKLRNLQCKRNPYICSYIIMIQNLVQQVNDTYGHVLSVIYRKFNIQLEDSYRRFRADRAFKAADNLLNAYMQDEADKFTDNIVNNKEIIAIWSEIMKRLYDMKNVTDARIEAYHNLPEEDKARYNFHEKNGYCEPKK